MSIIVAFVVVVDVVVVVVVLIVILPNAHFPWRQSFNYLTVY